MYIARTVSIQVFILFLIISLLTPLLASAQSRPERVDRDLIVSRDLGRAVSAAARHTDSEVIVKFVGDTLPQRIRTNGRQVADLISELEANVAVEYAEPNYIATAYMVPNDTYYNPYQWNFDNSTNGGVHAEAAWDVTDGSGVVVAIIDTGVAYENYGNGWFNRYSQAPDLSGTSFVAGYDFVNNDTHANDDQGHGTHVAGTIAGATNNGEGVAGLAHGATIMPIKVLDRNGSGTYADVADGIRYAADHGAQVINLSLGGPVGASYLEEALQYAHGKGVTIVAASGNDAASSVGYPAAYDDYVIAVGATRFDKTRAPYSNTGSSLDIVAPGGDTSVDQNNDGYGDGILQQTLNGSNNSFGYFFYQGTSMATPHVAAAAAMVLASGKASTPDGVRSVLESTAEDLGAPGRDNTYGHGLLNVAAAVSGTIPPPDPTPEPEPEPEPTPNAAPVAEAGNDITVTDTDLSGAESVNLDGSDSSDSDGTIVAHEWYEGATHLGTGATLSVSLDVGVHTIELRVTDNDGDTSTDSLTVTVNEGTPVPPEPETSILFEDGFEGGLGNWTQGPQEDWKLSTRQRYAGRYGIEVDGRATDALIYSPILTTAAATVRVSFAWLIERSLDTGEYIAFDISTDGGATWTEYARQRGDVDAEDTWVTVSETVATTDTIQIRFRGTMSSSIEDAYVDAIMIEKL